MKVAIAQIAPAFMDRARTLAKAAEWVGKAAESGAKLVCFGETVVPGYPVWLCRTDGARFEDPVQKELHALYVRESVCIEDGELEGVCAAAAKGKIAVVLGLTERPRDRGHSLFCARVFIDTEGRIGSVHRKLMPTYEERLCWGVGDGAGLVTHRLEEFTVGALNCWENWMPLTRASLYGQGWICTS
jgi:nitrilase